MADQRTILMCSCQDTMPLDAQASERGCRGANVVTGEYSRGANGLWIEDGEIAHPVQEVTVSGSLLELLQSIDALGNDLELRSSTAAPTLRIAEAMISGS